jgi:hypothetical protein
LFAVTIIARTAARPDRPQPTRIAASAGVIAIVVVGGLAVLALVVVRIGCCLRRRRRVVQFKKLFDKDVGELFTNDGEL